MLTPEPDDDDDNTGEVRKLRTLLFPRAVLTDEFICDF